ncbi:MAG: twin-arginine translocase TatA/TatE family subunit [Rubripirellula sp.]|jgi:sec-independent protein translocase protein TatA|nr:twin-arginine translocase TatA/TatE family subunit [Rubripirellula sp.]
MFGLGPFELVMIGVVAVILFGGNLPDVARKLGGSYREFRRGINEVQQQFKVAEYEAKKTMSSIENAVTDIAKEHEEEEETSGPVAPKFKPPPSA